MLKKKITQILENSIFEKSILSLILLNLIVLILDSLTSFHQAFYQYVKAFEMFSIGVFTIEFLLRLFVIQKPKDLLNIFLIIDFLAIFPYYITFNSANTIFLRIIRLSRIMRVLKIARYSEAIKNIQQAFKEKKEELIITFSFFIIGIILSAILIYFAENKAQPDVFSSIPKCLYFSVITFTSTGYGDMNPITPFGMFIASIISIFGIALHGLFVGIIGTALMSAFKKEKTA